MRAPRLSAALPALALLAAVLLACREAKESVRPDSQRIPAPDPNAAPRDVPPAAERAALGSSGQGRGPAPADASPQARAAEEEAKLAVNASLADAKQRAAAHSADGRLPAAPPLPAGGEPVDRVTLVFSASAAGQLVPCGCSPDMRGGLPRAAGLLSQWRAEEPGLVYVEAGDLLFATDKKVNSGAGAQAELKARTLAQGVELCAPAARILGARDLAWGPAFVAGTAGAAPLLDAGTPVPRSRGALVVRAGAAQVPVGLFAAGLGEGKPEALIAERAAQLRREGARLLVLVLHPRGDRAHAAAAALLPAARAAGVDLVVLGRRDDPALDPDGVEAGPPLLVRVEGHGQSLLRVDLALPRGAAPGAPLVLARGADGRAQEAEGLAARIAMFKERLAATPDDRKAMLEQKIAELEARRTQVLTAPDELPAGTPVAQVRFVKLGREVPEDAKVQALVAAYDAQVARANLEAAKALPAACPPAKKGEAAFTGVSAPAKKGGDSCAACHLNEAAFWARTPHARAYQSLVEVKKEHSLDCVRCHVTGWQQPGGVCRIDKTAEGGPGLAGGLGHGRQGVQCEMCHGPMSAHAARGTEVPRGVPEAVCVRCHEAENSPHFSYARYRPWIVGPGHGQPLGKGEAPRSLGEIEAGHARGPNAALRAAAQGARP